MTRHAYTEFKLEREPCIAPWCGGVKERTFNIHEEAGPRGWGRPDNAHQIILHFLVQGFNVPQQSGSE